MSYDHILQKLNILPSFEISRRISPTELKNIKNEVNKLKLKGVAKSNKFDEEIDKFTQEILKKEPVPGLLNRQLMTTQRTHELMKFSIYLGKEIKKLKLSKEEESFIIVSLVKLLELGIMDFKKWSKQQQDMMEDDGVEGDGEDSDEI
jgi:hypothetical protein